MSLTKGVEIEARSHTLNTPETMEYLCSFVMECCGIVVLMFAARMHRLASVPVLMRVSPVVQRVSK